MPTATRKPRQFHTGAYMFSIPTLPRDLYDTVKRWKTTYGLTQWQSVVLALRELEATEGMDTTRFEALTSHYRDIRPA